MSSRELLINVLFQFFVFFLEALTILPNLFALAAWQEKWLVHTYVVIVTGQFAAASVQNPCIMSKNASYSNPGAVI